MARPKETERQSKSGQTRQKLLEAAAGEFARAGYLGANINTISSTAGYAKGTIYNYFATKNALLLALIAATAQQHVEFMSAKVLVESDQARRLELFFQAGFEFVACYGPQAQVLFNTLHDPDPALKAYVFECYQPLFRFLTREILAPGIERGVFRPVEPEAMTMLLMTIYLGTASQRNLQGQPFLNASQVVGLILDGLRGGRRR
jgi:AcrR family transcriptional regulator